MRILVLSDSHRRGGTLERIIRSEPGAREIFFLGDLVSDIVGLESVFPDRIFHIVSGNCDFASTRPAEGLAEVDGVRIFYTHGHTHGVKYGTDRLLAAARARDCRVALYGHTHIASSVYRDGIYLINPGSCSSPRDGAASYAVVDFKNGSVLPAILRLE